eukprot:s1029_g4.t1
MMLPSIPETRLNALSSKMNGAGGHTPEDGSPGLSPSEASGHMEWMIVALRQERQAVQHLLLAQHEAFLQRLRDSGPDDSPLRETPKMSQPPYVSSSRKPPMDFLDAEVPSEGRPRIPVSEPGPGRRVTCSFFGETKSPSKDDRGIRFELKLDALAEGGPGPYWYSVSEGEAEREMAEHRRKGSQQSSRTPSIVYGDRHPDQGLFHCDCSSMRNFVKGPFFETSFAILILVNTIFMALEA